MKYATYNKYKPSPMAWLDQLPSHWNSASLRWMSKRYAGGTPDKGNEAYWENGDIPWINSGAVNEGYITKPSELITREGFASSSAKWIPKDALVMALAGQGKTKGMVAQLGIPTTCNQSMAALIPDQRFTPRYLYYWLTANYQNIRNLAGGEARDGLNLEMLGSIPCPVPPVDEQQTIARFLDAKTAQIDALVAQKSQLIEKLKEKRQALIARTVTRGLPPEAAKAAGLEPHPEMMDSGGDWLGEMPSGWKIMPLRRLIKFVKTGNTPSGAEEYHFEVEGFNWYTPSDFSEDIYLGHANRALSAEGKAEVRVFPEKTVMLVGIGATIGKVGLALSECSCNQQINAIGCGSALNPIFATYYLKILRDFIVKCGKFTTMPIINQDETKNLVFTVPPLAEQSAIATYLDHETIAIDQLMNRIDEAIYRLTEYRQALITSAVTGKIDVQGLA
ncbi:restriction endonuclease subunit S [Aeromonas sp. QDB25]|uniref:restriction endonuclease subunit S n=1 Tax=Aeromonas sp. QDB25 TaxID=2989832 RepID=UPI0022E2F2E5|nr:restriction endonuclease subunit S [Aeromonas sp. QDB25]